MSAGTFHVEHHGVYILWSGRRAYKGAKMPNPTKLPAMPSPSDAMANLRNDEIQRRRKGAQGFSSTLLTTPDSQTQPSFTGSPYQSLVANMMR